MPIKSKQQTEFRPTTEEMRMTIDCRSILQEAIDHVNPVWATRNHCRIVHDNVLRIGRSEELVDYRGFGFDDYDKIVVVAFGKASAGMATSLVEVMMEAKTPLPSLAGLVIVKDGHATTEQSDYLQGHKIKVREAAHPVPDQRSVDASLELLQLLRENASSRTLVLVCISGGGSALFCAPKSPLTLEDLQETNQRLLQSGWSIHDINKVRKRLEHGKGGDLARVAGAETTVVSLILSDVLGDPLDLIASGPTVPDTSTWQDAWDLVKQLPPEAALPSKVMQFLEEGYQQYCQEDPLKNGQIVETEEKTRKRPLRYNFLVGNNELAVHKAAEVAQLLGYHPVVLGTQWEGEAKEVAQVLVAMTQHLKQPGGALLHEYSLSTKYPIALIAGGETTVTLGSNSGKVGKGGRNQELALAAALLLQQKKIRNVVLASVGTDGTDGPTDAAGAIVDGGLVGRMPGGVQAAKDALTGHDAYNYLKDLDMDGLSPLLCTGPTGTNVADLMCVLIDQDCEHTSDIEQ